MIVPQYLHQVIFKSFYLKSYLKKKFLIIFRLSNYDNTKCTQDESVGFTLRLLVTPGPVILLLIALMFIWKHPIDEIRRNEIREEMIKIRFIKNKII